MHFGVKHQRQITYKEFTQILLGKSFLFSLNKNKRNFSFRFY